MYAYMYVGKGTDNISQFNRLPVKFHDLIVTYALESGREQHLRCSGYFTYLKIEEKGRL